jgi:hypothetical protein
VLLQEYLFKTALKEYGIDCDITVDHKNGINIVGTEKFGIKYPRSYIDQIKNLNHNKLYDYCFIGSWTDNKGRKEILEKYIALNAKMYHSSNGRDPKKKYQFDVEYYQTMCNSKFGLCPGHPAMPKHPNRWTYRFIESAFCHAIPVMFTETVYGDNFIKDICYVWDHDQPITDQIDLDKFAQENFVKAVTYWTLQPDEIDRIQFALNK